MRFRLAVLVSALVGLGGFVAPGLVSAAPRHNHHLTIAAAPNPVLAGEGVLIYGQLQGTNIAGQPIRLYHHLEGSGKGYSLVGTTQTDSHGFYEFTRQEGVVYTNRNWFVRGPDATHSRTIHEKVEPLVSLTASTPTTDTNHKVVFTGQVTPNHAYERVFLQEQIGSSDDWRTLTSGTLGAGSRYLIAYRWRRPGTHDVRVVFRGDARNIKGASDPVTENIEQAQVPGFTINSSQPITPVGSSVTISGVLDQPGTSTAEPNTPVQLWGHRPDQRHYVLLASGVTGSNGSYSFPQGPLTTNTDYYVATLPAKHVKRRRTAVLHQGVQDIVTIAASSPTTTTGQSVTITGSVTPDKAGHVIYLQKQGKDGDWHNVAVQVVSSSSTYQFTWSAGDPGTYNLRARITSDERNVGAHSAPVTVTVSLPPVSSLPPAS